jgi:hypothetical protein
MPEKSRRIGKVKKRYRRVIILLSLFLLLIGIWTLLMLLVVMPPRYRQDVMTADAQSTRAEGVRLLTRTAEAVSR